MINKKPLKAVRLNCHNMTLKIENTKVKVYVKSIELVSGNILAKFQVFTPFNC